MNIELFRKDKLAFGIAILMIVFGIAEIITGFRHEFFGLVTTEQLLTTITGAGLGLCYFNERFHASGGVCPQKHLCEKERY